jgi:hypothetical protein
MKKYFVSIIAIVLLVVGLVATRSSTYSASDMPYKGPITDEPGLSACKKTAVNTGYLMRKAWFQNLNELMAQEKPTSEKVDEGYESLRTYRCWLDYLCEAVLYSGQASEVATRKDPKNPNSQRPLTKAEIRHIPGCVSPNGIEIPGVKLEYIPACGVGPNGTIVDANANFYDCQALVNREFSGDTGASSLDPGASLAFIALNNTLRADSADGEIKPLREKFTSILMKMLSMEDHMTTLKEQILTLDKKLPCYVDKCD